MQFSLQFDEIKDYSKLVEEEIINNELEYEYINDEALYDSKNYIHSYSTYDIETYSDQFKKFEIYCYIKLNKENEYIFPVQSDLLNINEQYIYELIENLVKVINDKKFEIKYKSNTLILFRDSSK